MFWVKAHAGNKGNERADELAKKGLSEPQSQDTRMSNAHRKSLYREHMNKIWQEEWTGTTIGKRTKVWLSELAPKKSRQLMRLPRQDLGLCMQWITGFCNLMRHRHKNHKVVPDTCRLCQQDMETPEHLSFHCPRLIQARAEIFNTRIGPPDTWTPKQIVTFIQSTKCKDLMKDETDYGNMTGNSSQDIETSNSRTETSNSRNSISI